MNSFTATGVCDSRTAVYGNRSFADSGTAENVSNAGKSKLARFVLNVLRMRNANDRKGSILMEYLVVLFWVGFTLAVYFAKNFYSFPDAAVASDPRVNPAGFYADASEIADVSINTATKRLFHGIHFVRFYQRTMGGIALPVP